MKRIFLSLMVAIAFVSFSQAQSTLTDYKTKTDKNSKERNEMLDAIRADLMLEGYPEFKFVVNHFKLKDGFAFFKGDAQNQDGTAYKPKDPELDCCHVEVLLKKVNGKWTVVSSEAFATDVWWICLWKEHNAPKEIFDVTDPKCDY